MKSIVLATLVPWYSEEKAYLLELSQYNYLWCTTPCSKSAPKSTCTMFVTIWCKPIKCFPLTYLWTCLQFLISFPPTWITRKIWRKPSTKDHDLDPGYAAFTLASRYQVLRLWSGSANFKTLDYQRTNPREYQRELTQCKPLEYKTQHHPTTSSMLCRMLNLNNKNKNTNLIISRQDYHITQPYPSEEK